MFTKIIKNLHTPKWLFILLSFVIIFRIPSLFEPYSYGDEMIYLTLGNAIRKGATLYSQIHDNKPPLLYIIAALAGNLFWFKAILTVWHITTIFIFWKLTLIIFPKKKIAQICSTAFLAVLTTIPTLEGNIVNAELFMIGPTILAFLILLSKKLTPKYIFLSGILFSISSLFKVPALFDIGAIAFVWLVQEKTIDKKKLVKIITNILYLSAGVLTPIGLTFLWYWLKGAADEYTVAVYLQNFGYLSSWRPSDTEKPFFIRNAPLLFRTAIVTLGLLILTGKRKRLSIQFTFSSVWLLLTLFAVTLSERPYPHYLIQSTPPIALLLGILLTSTTIEQSLSIIPLAIAVFVPVYFDFWHYPTFSYYLRFTGFITGKITKNDYLSSFDKQAPSNYKIAEYIVSSTKENEKVFVWGEGSVIYALSRRLPPIKYIADYHINDFSSNSEVFSLLEENPPSFVVVLKDSRQFPQLSSFLTENYGLVKTIDGSKIWKLLSPKIRSLII